MAKSNEELKNLSNSLAEAVEIGERSLVLVNARKRFPASGVAIEKDLVLTASHVVRRDEDINVILPDGTELSAELLGRDPNSDLALLRLAEAKATPAKVTKVDPQIGQVALALGRPTSEGVQASLGIVSAIGGPTRTMHGGFLEAHLRTDAIPYPGFSGGSLVDGDGQVLGINTSGLGRSSSLTIPAKVAWKIAASIKEHGGVKRGFLGIRSQLVELPAKSHKLLGRVQSTGLLIVGVEKDSPAASGLIVGDIIVGLNGQPASDHDELLGLLTSEVVGQPTPVEVLRGGKLKTVDVTIGERKSSSGFIHGHQFRRRHAKRFWRGPWGWGHR